MLPLHMLALVALGTYQDAPVPPADRSGEPELRRVLKSMGNMRKFVALVNFSEHDRSGDPFIPDRTTTLWYDSPSRFRIVNTSVWGDSTLFVSDGKSLYYDPLDDQVPAYLRTAAKDVPNSHPSLGMKGSNWSILYFLLTGEAAFDRLVAPDTDIVVARADGMRRIWFNSKEIGTVQLYYLDDGRAVRVDYDNKPTRMARYRTIPMWFDRPENPLEREVITYEPPVFARDTFRTDPPKGRKVIDQREKGK